MHFILIAFLRILIAYLRKYAAYLGCCWLQQILNQGKPCPKNIYFSENQKPIEIQYFDAKKNDPSLCMHKDIRVPPTPPTWGPILKADGIIIKMEAGQ